MDKDKIFFQKMETHALEKKLMQIAEQNITAGVRTLIRVPNQSCLKKLDDYLWTHGQSSFTVHGTPETGFLELQPIYLSCTSENPNQAKFLVLFGDTQADEEEYQSMEEIHVLFDTNHTDSRRNYWRELVQKGYTPISLSLQ